jgi:hypothetical protein
MAGDCPFKVEIGLIEDLLLALGSFSVKPGGILLNESACLLIACYTRCLVTDISIKPFRGDSRCPLIEGRATLSRGETRSSIFVPPLVNLIPADYLPLGESLLS